MSPTPQTPPTDRPLTAGDWITHEGGSNPVPGQRVDVEHEGKWITEDVPSDQRDDLWRHDDPEDDMNIIAYRLARPATSAASEGEGVEPWEPAAEAMCAEVIERAEVTCRKATDELYEGLLYSVQDYLRENVMLNLSGELERAHGYERDARTALVEIAKAAGVNFVDSRDGVDRQKERILAALASPPVSEREDFDTWMERLRTDVIQDEYGYEEGEFDAAPADWRQMYDKGLSPSDAFRRALTAHREPVSERERELEALVVELLKHSVSHYGSPTDEDHGVGLIHARARALTAQPAGEGK